MEKFSKKEQIIKETTLLVRLFLETNESDLELSKRTGISSSTVGRRLTNKEIIVTSFPKNGERIYNIIKEKRKYNLQRGKIIGNQSSLLNYMEIKSNTPKLRLDIIYRDYNKQLKFLSHLALHFRAKFPLLEELFGIDAKKLLNDLIKYNENCYESLLYLFYQDNTNQEYAKANIIEYYRNLIDAISKKDISTQNVLIREIGDSKIVKFQAQHKNGDIKSNEDIMTLLNYQLKYAISSKKLAEKFNFDRAQYVRRVRDITSNMPELNMRYEELTDYHKERNFSQWK